MSECKTVTLRTRPLKNGMLSFYLDSSIWTIIRATVTRKR